MNGFERNAVPSLNAVRAAIELPFDEGLKKEREGFLKLVASDQSKMKTSNA